MSIVIYIHKFCGLSPWLVARPFDIDQFDRALSISVQSVQENMCNESRELQGRVDILLVVRHSQLALIDSGQCLPAWLACVR